MKIKKRIMALLTVLSLVLLTVQPVSASEIAETRAGEETWYKGGTYPAEYTFTDTNLTPVKTMGSSGHLQIYGEFCQNDNPSYSMVQLTVQIREYGTGRILDSVTVQNKSYSAGFTDGFTVYTDVTAGQKIQLFFDVSTVPGYPKPGPYRSAYLKYEAELI